MANFLKIQKFLDERKIKYKIIDLGGEIFRVEEVVKAGVKADEIVKTLLVKGEVKNGLQFKTKYFALVLRGRDRLDFKKVKRLFGTKSTLASAEDVMKIVGVPVGAVCPILVGAPVFFDKKVFQTFLRFSDALGLKKVMDLSWVNMGSGDLTKGLEMSLEDLKKAVGKYRVEDLTSRS